MKHHSIKTAKVLTATAALALLAACSGTKSTEVVELTKYDKHMSCPELQVEITEATFLRDKALRNRGLSVKNVVMPLSYPSTYMSSSNAEESASNRIEYLTRLHEIKGCAAAQGQYASADPMGYGMADPMMQQPAAAPVGYQQPVGYAQQPVQMQQMPRGYGAPQQYARPSYGY